MRKSRFLGLLIILILVVSCDVYEQHLDEEDGGSNGGVGIMQVLESSVVISYGDTVDFGSFSVSSGSAAKTFTIKNIGDGTLELDAGPVVITGVIDHWYNTQPAVSIASGQSTTFQIIFDPDSMGFKENSVHINYTDSGYWSFDIIGAGY